MDWVEDVIQLISCPGQNLLENIPRAQTLKRAHFPSSLFKYRVVNEYSLNNLRESSLYLAPAASFNDPFDSSFSFDPLFGQRYAEALVASLKEVDEAEKQRFLESPEPIMAVVEHYRNLVLGPHRMSDQDAKDIAAALEKRGAELVSGLASELVEGARKNYTICSLSARLDSLPLWAHYASNHTGFVMEYDFTKLSDSDLLSLSLWPVVYSGVFDARSLLNGFSPGKPFNNLLPLIAALHKSPDWSYENEWRIVMPARHGLSPQNYPAPLKAVYVGVKIADSDLDSIRLAATQAGVPLYRMKHNAAEFRVVPEENPL